MQSVEDYYIHRYHNETVYNTSEGMRRGFAELAMMRFNNDNNNNSGLTVDELEELLTDYDEYKKTQPQRHDHWEWILFCLTVYSTIGKE